MSFHIGQKVVCVDDGPPEFNLRKEGLRRGAIYTVREVGLRSWFDGAPAVRLMEIIRGPKASETGDEDSDTPFWAHRFRPLIEHKTDISVFKKILADASKEKEAAE